MLLRLSPMRMKRLLPEPECGRIIENSAIVTVMFNFKRSTILLLIVLLSAGDAEITTNPKDTEAVVGQLVYFNCSSSISAEIQWMFFGPGGDTEGSIVYGYNKIYAPFNERFRVEKKEAAATYNLIIDSITTADAGKYECQDDVGRGTKSSAQLIVLASEPICQSNIDTSRVIGTNRCGIEPDQLILSCTANFYGNEPPIMQWMKDGNGNAAGKLTNEIRGNLVIYNLSMKAESSINNSFYTCNTTRSVSPKNSCRSNTIQIVGTSSDTSCVPCPPANNYQGYLAVIICIILIILPIVAVGAIAFAWYYLYKRFKRAEREKENMESIFYCGLLSRCMKHSSSDSAEEVKHLAEPQLDENKETIQVGVSLGPDFTLKITHPPEVESVDKENEQRREETKQYATKIQEMEEKIKELQKTGKQKDGIIKELEESVKQKDTTITALQTEDIQSLNVNNDKLRRIIHNLESHLYPSDTIDYKEKLNLVQTISIRSEQNPDDAKKDKRDRPAVKGIAILGKELFVANDQSADIDVFNSETFICQRHFFVENMQCPLDLASSKDTKCLYIISLAADNTKSEIFRTTAKGDVLDLWASKGRYGRLSTYESNVIVCLFEEQKIYEYTPNGEIITIVALSPGSGFSHPLHAIKVTHLHFVVSHGETRDDLHRVCVVDKEGKIIRVLGTREKKSKHSRVKLNVPICLLEDRERRILVADRDNRRVLLLSSFLKFQRKIIDCNASTSDVPVRLCFDETVNRIFVAVNKPGFGGKIWKDGLIHVLNIQK